MRAVSRRLAASFCRSAVTCASSSTIGVLPDFSRVSISPRTLRTVVRATLLRSFMWLTTSACRRSFRVVIVLLVLLTRLAAEPVGPDRRDDPLGVFVREGGDVPAELRLCGSDELVRRRLPQQAAAQAAGLVDCLVIWQAGVDLGERGQERFLLGLVRLGQRRRRARRGGPGGRLGTRGGGAGSSQQNSQQGQGDRGGVLHRWWPCLRWMFILDSCAGFGCLAAVSRLGFAARIAAPARPRRRSRRFAPSREITRFPYRRPARSATPHRLAAAPPATVRAAA